MDGLWVSVSELAGREEVEAFRWKVNYGTLVSMPPAIGVAFGSTQTHIRL